MRPSYVEGKGIEALRVLLEFVLMGSHSTAWVYAGVHWHQVPVKWKCSGPLVAYFLVYLYMATQLRDSISGQRFRAPLLEYLVLGV